MSKYAKGEVISVVLNAAATAGLCGRLSGLSGGSPLAIQGTDGTTATAHNNCLIFLQSGVSGDIVLAQMGGQCEFATAGAAITIGSFATTGAAGKVTAAVSGDRAFLRVVGGNTSTGATSDGSTCVVEFIGPIDIA